VAKIDELLIGKTVEFARFEVKWQEKKGQTNIAFSSA
jgi:hypothetical protein